MCVQKFEFLCSSTENLKIDPGRLMHTLVLVGTFCVQVFLAKNGIWNINKGSVQTKRQKVNLCSTSSSYTA